jgi:MFS family permease
MPPRIRIPYAACLLVGLGGLFAGVTGPLLSAFVPPLVQQVLGDDRLAIGAVLAIDNVLLLVLVPWAGGASDRARANGGGRLPLVLAGVLLASVGMALFPASASLGLGGLLAAMLLLYSGINLQRAPFQALIADLVPSRHRPLATASVTFQMCVAAIVFLMLGQLFGMRIAFRVAAACVLAIAVAFAYGLRESRADRFSASTASRSLMDAARSAVQGEVAGMRAIFAASLLLQLTFQTFTSWYALHAIERFGVPAEDVTVGFVAWAAGGMIGAVPAGVIGARFGRRRTILLGFGMMSACLIVLDRMASLAQTLPLVALASAAWALPTVNAYPLFVEQVPVERRGVLAALFVLCTALGGAIGDPLNGAIFNLAGSYRLMFVLMGAYTLVAFAAVLLVPRGAGEVETGVESTPALA